MQDLQNDVFLRSELLNARQHFKKGEVLQSLAILDRLVKASNSLMVPYLRALLRESVNDLTGSLSDIKIKDLNPEQAITKARILSKLGLGDEAITTLRNLIKDLQGRNQQYWVTSAIGIAGRRFDLELCGLRPDVAHSITISDARKAGCIIEHLIALGNFEICIDILRNVYDNEYSLTSICNDIKNSDKLMSITRNGLRASQVQPKIQGIRGWLSIDEATLLATLASKVSFKHDIVEIGSFLGRSTCALAFGSKIGSSVQVHAVDPHSRLAGIFEGSTLRAFRTNLRLKHVEDNVKLHATTSAKSACIWKNKKIGLLFIDGAHDYESVKNDFNGWLPRMSQEGYVAFHDCNQPGPNRLIREIIQKYPSIELLGLRDTLFIMQLYPITSESEVCSQEKGVWLKYLAILGSNYSKWMEQCQRTLQRLTLKTFDRVWNS